MKLVKEIVVPVILSVSPIVLCDEMKIKEKDSYFHHTFPDKVL